MTKRISKKVYAKIQFVLSSPLMIGSGENIKTDHDLVYDSQGRPYIPASALAGVTREILKRHSVADIDKYYGNISKSSKTSSSHKQVESRVVFYDAVLTSNSPCYISVRDSVALDEYKTAKKGAKFDSEILEAGAIFETYLEQDYYSSDDADFIRQIGKALLSDEFSLGGKTSRGYGRIKNVEILIREYSMESRDDIEAWLGFDLFAENDGWTPDKSIEPYSEKCLTLTLQQNGPMTIRKYATTINSNSHEPEPDFEFLSSHDGEEEKPVVPGTTWAGAFLSDMVKWNISEREKDEMFGFVRGNKARSSRLMFGESQIDDFKSKVIVRNAIDRFTAGTLEHALYTERTVWGGTTKLRIMWRGESALSEHMRELLAESITDIHLGYTAIGGGTSVGRGLFHVSRIEDQDVTDDDIYDVAFQKIGEVFQ